MRVLDNTVKDRRSKNAEFGFEEFTKAEIASLFPATELLQKIHTDHVYTSKEYEDHSHNSQELPLDISSDDNSHHEDDILSLNADSIQQVFQRMLNMTSLNTMTGQTKGETEETISNYESPKTSIIRKVKFVDELPGPSGTSLTSTPREELGTAADDKTENGDLVRKSGRKRRGYKKRSYSHSHGESNDHKDNKPNGGNVSSRARNKKQGNGNKEKDKTRAEEGTICKSVSGNEWRTANRCAEMEREMNTLIQYTAELLVLRLAEYLSMTMEQISSFEIENAKQHKMVEEVVDMLEDKDRYVWQLIEELQFF